MTDEPTTRNQLIEQAARALAEKFTEPHGRRNRDWDIDGPDDDTNPYYLPLPMSERFKQGAWIKFTAADGQTSVRSATLDEIAEALADAGLLADPAALLSRLADLTETAGKQRSTEWLRTCATLPPDQWPPAPGYKGPMVPAAEVEELRAELEEHKAIAARDEASVNRARADRDLALWLHAEAKLFGEGWHQQWMSTRETVHKLQAHIDAVPNILRQHYLAWIECDHDQKMDNPQCACSKVDLGWHPTVGDAVNAWIEHVRAALQGDQPTEPEMVSSQRIVASPCTGNCDCSCRPEERWAEPAQPTGEADHG